MQLTIDISDELYRELAEDASSQAVSIQQMASLRLQAKVAPSPTTGIDSHRVTFPLLHATTSGTLDLTQNLNDSFFEEFHAA